jgi:hypothetical protein
MLLRATNPAFEKSILLNTTAYYTSICCGPGVAQTAMPRFCRGSIRCIPFQDVYIDQEQDKLVNAK